MLAGILILAASSGTAGKLACSKRQQATFFAGGLVGYYGAAVLSVWLPAWEASLHRHFRRYLFLAANILLLILGISYLLRAAGVRL